MTCALHVAWDERLTDYHFGPGHPLAPVRVELTMRLAHEFGHAAMFTGTSWLVSSALPATSPPTAEPPQPTSLRAARWSRGTGLPMASPGSTTADGSSGSGTS